MRPEVIAGEADAGRKVRKILFFQIFFDVFVSTGNSAVSRFIKSALRINNT
jgi:hypothetical protein